MQDERARLKAAGFTDAEIDAELGASAKPAIKSFAAESSAVAPKPKEAPKAAESWSTRGKLLSGARAGAQGLLFGFGDEAEALASSLVTKKPYQEELSRIRGEMGEFREAYPKTALAAEVAGGFATGAGMAGVAAKGVKGASALSRALAKSATAQGALSGAGSAEGGVQSRLAGAGVGGVLGGATGAVLGKVGGKVAERISRGGPLDPGTKVMIDAMDAARMDEGAVTARAAQMAKDSPEARMMDVLGNPAVRVARRIDALGGTAGEDIHSAMQNRLQTRPERFQDALTRTTGRGAENVVETVDDIVARRKEISDPLYQNLYQQPPLVDDEVERLLRNPGMKGPVQRALELMGIEERPVQMMQAPDGTMQPVRTPEFLDSVKKALDDVIYRGKQPGEGGLGPSMLSALKAKRAEYVQLLDDRLPGYAEARSAWAGETALKNALEEGSEFATKRTDPRQIAKAMTDMSESEIEMVQRGWLDGIRQRIDMESLTPKQIRTPAFKKQVEAVFGGDADNILRSLSTELELNTNVGQVISGSPTARIFADMGLEAPQSQFSRAFNALEMVKSRPFGSIARAADYVSATLGGPKAAAERVQKAQTLLTPASEAGSVMEGVRQAAQARQIGRQTQRVAGTAVGRLTGRGTVRTITGDQERNP